MGAAGPGLMANKLHQTKTSMQLCLACLCASPVVLNNENRLRQSLTAVSKPLDTSSIPSF